MSLPIVSASAGSNEEQCPRAVQAPLQLLASMASGLQRGRPEMPMTSQSSPPHARRPGPGPWQRPRPGSRRSRAGPRSAAMTLPCGKLLGAENQPRRGRPRRGPGCRGSSQTPARGPPAAGRAPPGSRADPVAGSGSVLGTSADSLSAGNEGDLPPPQTRLKLTQCAMEGPARPRAAHGPCPPPAHRSAGVQRGLLCRRPARKGRSTGS